MLQKLILYILGANKCGILFYCLQLRVVSSWPTVINKKLSNTKGKMNSFKNWNLVFVVWTDFIDTCTSDPPKKINPK